MNRLQYRWPGRTSLGDYAPMIVRPLYSARAYQELSQIEYMLNSKAGFVGELTSEQNFDFCVGVLELPPDSPYQMFDTSMHTCVLGLVKCGGTQYKYVFKCEQFIELRFMAPNVPTERLLQDVIDRLYSLYIGYNALAGIRMMTLERDYAMSIHPNPSL